MPIERLLVVYKKLCSNKKNKFVRAQWSSPHLIAPVRPSLIGTRPPTQFI